MLAAIYWMLDTIDAMLIWQHKKNALHMTNHVDQFINVGLLMPSIYTPWIDQHDLTHTQRHDWVKFTCTHFIISLGSLVSKVRALHRFLPGPKRQTRKRAACCNPQQLLNPAVAGRNMMCWSSLAKHTQEQGFYNHFTAIFQGTKLFWSVFRALFSDSFVTNRVCWFTVYNVL
jgi:hypothetical protein